MKHALVVELIDGSLYRENKNISYQLLFLIIKSRDLLNFKNNLFRTDKQIKLQANMRSGKTFSFQITKRRKKYYATLIIITSYYHLLLLLVLRPLFPSFVCHTFCG